MTKPITKTDGFLFRTRRINTIKKDVGFLALSSSTSSTTPSSLLGLSASSTSMDTTTSNPAPLAGVSDFENWFASLGNQATCLATIQHAAFGSLRGLEFSGEDNEQQQQQQLGEQLSVLQIPNSIVLATNAGDNDWDATLAKQLWEECQKGTNSNIKGYCSLLTRGQSMVDGTSSQLLPSVAPNALRRWTAEQRAALEQSDIGKRLLTKFEEQKQSWQNKYVSTGCNSQMSWEQFEWCMEVIHSRAFRGNRLRNN
eukprot:CAMPEP_0202475654 /NCGR_PEP_ID=MMETSP1360-20130828/93019_1 /ASSEMBLY_ACC=CAM_ASM_000848 /TAXON_ID=515479 /ORGANISM="Licmophora paradoxa, Strain CCMP2313" /LENGTH=254 /DNA_ID=CAMNT_0049102833 /DNA_START=66 /DNA_END=830 /DNA_ORIENTATION=-